MKHGRFSVVRGMALQCKDCGFAYPVDGCNPESIMIAEEKLDSTHICPKPQAHIKVRVLVGTSPQAIERAKFAMGYSH